MIPKTKYKIALAVMAMLAIIFLIVLPARAAPPSNDDISGATIIINLPYSEYINTSEATVGDDPNLSCNYHGTFQATVWYQFIAPASQLVTASSAGSTYYASIGVFTGDPGLLSEFACSTDNQPVTFQADSGITYYIMVADTGGGPYPVGSNGGWLNFTLSEAAPPVAYFYAYSAPDYGLRSFWFDNQSYDPLCWGCQLAAFWDFGDGSTSSDWRLYHQFPTDGSYTVTLTVTTPDGRSATYQLQVDVVTPPPVAGFYPSPPDPSTFDSVYFYNWSYDPGCYCQMTAQWNFGDGTNSTDWSPSHQYTANGSFEVSLTVTTPDGRSASTSQVLLVQTIDVAITKFTVPQSAKAGQTRSISVDVNNTTTPVLVEVHLYKSTVTGWQWVGTLQQYVPVRPSNRTTGFDFSYTFTQDDALLGKMNFRAEASIVNGRDAIPTNNEAISLPTKVSR